MSGKENRILYYTIISTFGTTEKKETATLMPVRKEERQLGGTTS